jgi:hypothetical protein
VEAKEPSLRFPDTKKEALEGFFVLLLSHGDNFFGLVKTATRTYMMR